MLTKIYQKLLKYAKIMKKKIFYIIIYKIIFKNYEIIYKKNKNKANILFFYIKFLIMIKNKYI